MSKQNISGLSKDQPKIIFIDLDGTLLSHTTNTIPESAIQALHLAKEKGILLFIASGRHKSALELGGWLKELSFDGYVTLNGQFCFLGDQIVHKKPIHPDDIRLVVEHLDKHPFPCIFFEADHMYINMVDPQTKSLFEGVEEELPPIREASRALKNEIYQLCVFGEEQKNTLLTHLKYSAYTGWSDAGWDIIPSDGNKWEGIKRVLSLLHISSQDAAAIGDGRNDIEMLENVGYSIAMGNASDTVKQYADFVTTHIDEDGLSNAIMHLISGQLDE